MNTLLQKIKANIEQNELIKGDAPIIVGVSGGVDSMVLLDVLHRLGYAIVVAHVNFQLRGEASNNDEKFVTQIAQKFNLPFEKISFDTQKHAKENGISIEMSARELRYAWFEQLSQKYQTENITVAHHADDNVETLLLNLVRGTGIKGLTGMKARNGKIIRPLLTVFRSDVEQYAQKHSIEYVTDATNFEDIYTRNKIRNQVIPLLEQINPSIRKTLNNNILNFQKSSDFYFNEIKKQEKEICTTQNEILYIDIKKLKKLEYSHIVLYEVLSKYDFHSDTIDDIFSKLNEQSGSEFFSTTHRLVKDRNELLIEKREVKEQGNEQKTFPINEKSFEINEPLQLKIKEITRTADFQFSTNPNCIHIDKSKLIYPLTIRRWKSGDKFQPIGMTNFKKVSDFFIDQKIDKLQKEKSWLLCNGNDEIIWIIGQRMDNRYKITKKTRDILEIKKV